MKSGIAIAALAVLPALLTGCGSKPQKVVVSPVAEAPSLPPSRMVANLSSMPPAIPITDPRPVKLDTAVPPEPKTVAVTIEPHHSSKHHSKSSETLAETKPSQAAAQSPAQITQMATSQPPDSSPIGPLSTQSDNVNNGDRQSISSLIDSTENGLNAIKRPLSSDEQKTAALIRSYVTRARDALKADDLEAATNLSNKAHQMLGELTKTQ